MEDDERCAARSAEIEKLIVLNQAYSCLQTFVIAIAYNKLTVPDWRMTTIFCVATFIAALFIGNGKSNVMNVMRIFQIFSPIAGKIFSYTLRLIHNDGKFILTFLLDWVSI